MSQYRGLFRTEKQVPRVPTPVFLGGGMEGALQREEFQAESQTIILSEMQCNTEDGSVLNALKISELPINRSLFRIM